MNHNSNVTRLGELSPIGRLLTLSSFRKISKEAQTLGDTFFSEKSNTYKNVLGHFFTNSSGHPAQYIAIFE
jgi:hypothetical protein